MKKFIALVFLFACSNEQTSQQKAEDAVKKYIKQNAHDASEYKPLHFGKLDSLYTTDSDTYDELDAKRKSIVASYNYARSQDNKASSDSIRAELLKINKQMDAGKQFSGLKIYHISQGKNEAGETVMNRGSFYLDTNYLVTEFVMTEDSTLTNDEMKQE